MTTKTYIEAIGRRKTATARVRMTVAKERVIVVNEMPVEKYFKLASHRAAIERLFKIEGIVSTHSFSAHVKGGGLLSQAEAIRLGIARALVEESHANRANLKKAGYMKRDPRAKERKKFGLRKARKRPQWSKR
jgi:small subunit ribosomal protein S9